MDAVMFDIDETLIHRDGTPMPKTINLLRRLKRQGYVVVVMTARPNTKESIHYTLQQLAYFKIPYDRLFFVPARHKTLEKNRMGLNFVLSVGDQPTDWGGSKKFINTSTGYYS